MAQARTFTDQNIIDAALEITGQGKNVNGTTLRRVVGSGRPATLMQAYEELVSSGKVECCTDLAAQEEVQVQSYELPIEVQEKFSLMTADLESMIQACNNYAHHVVETRLNKAIGDATKAKATAELQAAEALEQEEKAFNDLDSKSIELGKSLSANEILSLRIVELEKSLAIKESELSVATKRAESNEKALIDKDAAIIKLNTEKDTLASQSSKFEGALMQSKESVARMTQDAADSKGQIQALNDDKIANASEIATLKAETVGIKNRFNDLTKVHSKLESEHEVLVNKVIPTTANTVQVRNTSTESKQTK